MSSNPLVSQLHHKKLRFTNKKHEFHHKLTKTGEVMVVPEGSEMMPRTGAGCTMLSSAAFSDHKKIKSHHAMKELIRDKAGLAGKGHKHCKPNREHREHKNSGSKTHSRERECQGGKSTMKPSSSSLSWKSTENQGKDKGMNMADVAFKEPRESKGGSGGQVDLRALSKRPSSFTESSNLNTKKLKSLKECKKGSPIIVSSWISSTTDAPPSTYLEKKGMNKKSHWVKTRHETPVVKKRTDSTFNSEDEILSRSVLMQSVQSTSSSSCSSSSSESEFEPLQVHCQGPLHSMVEHLPSECCDNNRSSEMERDMKATPSCLFMDSDSDGVEESHPHSQGAPSPVLNTKNLKMLENKSPGSCKKEKVLKGDKAYTEELVDLHRRLMTLRERNILQQIVNLIEKTGHFNITTTTFDFDLFSLDESTVRELQSYLQAKKT